MVAGCELLDYLDDVAKNLAEKGAGALSGFGAGDVHDARVAARRLGVAVEVLAPLANRRDRKSLARGLKKARHLLGDFRDLDVVLERLGELGGEGRFGEGVKWLAGEVEERREVLRGAGGKVSSLKRWGSWMAEVGGHGDALRPVISEAVHDRLDEVMRRGASLDEPHPFRIAAKALRYALELADAAGVANCEGGSCEGLIERFKGVQDLLGAWHDWAMVAEVGMRAARRRGVAFRGGREGIAVAEVCLECLHRAQWKLGEFRAEWAREAVWFEQAVRSAFPLIDDVTQAVGAGVSTESVEVSMSDAVAVGVPIQEETA